MRHALAITVIALTAGAACSSGGSSSLCADNGSSVKMTAATAAGFSAGEAIKASSTVVIPVRWEDDPSGEHWPAESTELHLQLTDATDAREDLVGSPYCPAGVWVRAQVELHIDGGTFVAKDTTDIGFRGSLPDLELMFADEGLEVIQWPLEAEAIVERGMAATTGNPFTVGPRTPYVPLIGTASDLEVDLVFRATNREGAVGNYTLLSGHSPPVE